jgi:hypothetical protein
MAARHAGSLYTAQKRVWDNKVRKGFNTSDVPYEICLLQGEVAELFEAWRKKHPVGHELADVAIYLLGLSEMLGVDLERAISEKMLINERRSYTTAGGVLSKDEGKGPPPDWTGGLPRLRVVADQDESLF